MTEHKARTTPKPSANPTPCYLCIVGVGVEPSHLGSVPSTAPLTHVGPSDQDSPLTSGPSPAPRPSLTWVPAIRTVLSPRVRPQHRAPHSRGSQRSGQSSHLGSVPSTAPLTHVGPDDQDSPLTSGPSPAPRPSLTWVPAIRTVLSPRVRPQHRAPHSRGSRRSGQSSHLGSVPSTAPLTHVGPSDQDSPLTSGPSPAPRPSLTWVPAIRTVLSPRVRPQHRAPHSRGSQRSGQSSHLGSVPSTAPLTHVGPSDQDSPLTSGPSPAPRPSLTWVPAIRTVLSPRVRPRHRAPHSRGSQRSGQSSHLGSVPSTAPLTHVGPSDQDSPLTSGPSPALRPSLTWVPAIRTVLSPRVRPQHRAPHSRGSRRAGQYSGRATSTSGLQCSVLPGLAGETERHQNVVL